MTEVVVTGTNEEPMRIVVRESVKQMRTLTGETKEDEE
jgi:hypothetical protein